MTCPNLRNCSPFYLRHRPVLEQEGAPGQFEDNCVLGIGGFAVGFPKTFRNLYFMTRKRSPNKFVFIGGVPRSGTTWTQILITGHPQIASSRETHVLGRYVNEMLRIYDDQAENSPDGLHLLMDRDAFVKEYIGPVLKTTMKAIAAQSPGAKVVLEKTPRSFENFDIVDAVYGARARMLHVIRDPRSVRSSWLHASKEDWGEWAETSPRLLIERWIRTMEQDAEYAQKFGNRYRSIRYEDLLADPKGHLQDLLKWIGIDYDGAMITQMVKNASLDALKVADRNQLDPSNPQHEKRSNFFRKGTADGWKTELTEKQIKYIERLARAQMIKHGYVPQILTKKQPVE